MKIPQNRPAAASSYRGNPARMAIRERIRSTWIANPHLCAAEIARLCNITPYTAQQSRPTCIKHAATDTTSGIVSKRTAQDDLTWKLHLEDKSLFEIAEATDRSIKTTKRVIASMKRDRLLKSLQTTSP